MGYWRIPLIACAVGAVVLATLTVWYSRAGASTNETLFFVLIGLTALGGVTLSIFTAQILVATLQKEDRESAAEDRRLAAQAAHDELERKRAAFGYLERWNNPNMYHARDVLRDILREDRTEQQLKQFVSQGRETNVIHILNFMEEISTGCVSGVADEGVCRRTFDAIMIEAWTTLKPWVDDYRRHGHEDTWEDLEAVVRRWRRN
jgi:hypothetical protein